MLSENERYCGLGMDALVIVCSRNTNVIMAWAWMRDSMLSEHERYYGLGMDALVIVCSRNTHVIMAWTGMRDSMLSEHERYSGWEWMRDSMLPEHERYHGLGMDALVIVCSQNTNVIMVWAWMLWHSRSLFLEKRDAWYTQYFGPPNLVRATQATSGEVGQVCIFCALRRSH